MQKNMLLLFSVIFCWIEAHAAPAPQDFQSTALMMANKMKEIVENGAAAGTEQIKFAATKVKDGMAMGYSEVMKLPAGGKRRREIDSEAVGAGNSMSYETEYSDESELVFSEESLGEDQREKRAAAPDSGSRSKSSDSSSSWSSSSSSSSSSSASSSSSSESEDR